MRESHCSKTYQVGPRTKANPACFRAFLPKFTVFRAISDANGLPRTPRRSPCGASRCEVSPLWARLCTETSPVGGDARRRVAGFVEARTSAAGAGFVEACARRRPGQGFVEVRG